MLFRANPHLLLRARQATLHVTIRRSTTLASPQPHPSSPASIVRSTASPLLTRPAWAVLIPGRAAIENVNSWREGFRGARKGS
jgi:hypothetical protein